MTGALLARHKKIAKISFTGSTATGLKIQDAATKSNMKRVTLELGGKNPMIVFDDADIDTAVFWATMGIIVNSGQVCAATSRLYMQESIMDKFMGRMKASFEDIASKLGEDPMSATASYGPLVDKVQYDKVTGLVEARRARLS